MVLVQVRLQDGINTHPHSPYERDQAGVIMQPRIYKYDLPVVKNISRDQRAGCQNIAGLSDQRDPLDVHGSTFFSYSLETVAVFAFDIYFYSTPQSSSGVVCPQVGI